MFDPLRLTVPPGRARTTDNSWARFTRSRCRGQGINRAAGGESSAVDVVGSAFAGTVHRGVSMPANWASALRRQYLPAAKLEDAPENRHRALVVNQGDQQTPAQNHQTIFCEARTSRLMTRPALHDAREREPKHKTATTPSISRDAGRTAGNRTAATSSAEHPHPDSPALPGRNGASAGVLSRRSRRAGTLVCVSPTGRPPIHTASSSLWRPWPSRSATSSSPRVRGQQLSIAPLAVLL